MKAHGIEHLNPVSIPRDLTHDDWLTHLIRNPGKDPALVSTVGVPAPMTPEERNKTAPGLEIRLIRENLKPRPKQVADPYHYKVGRSLTEEISEIPDPDEVRRFYTSPAELTKLRNNSQQVSKFTFPLR